MGSCNFPSPAPPTRWTPLPCVGASWAPGGSPIRWSVPCAPTPVSRSSPSAPGRYAARRTLRTGTASRGRTAVTRNSSPILSSTSSMSPHRTAVTANTPCWPSRRASTSSSRRPSPAMRPRPTRSWPPLAAAASSAWRRCGRVSSRAPTSFASASSKASSVRSRSSSPTTGSPSTPTVPADSGTPNSPAERSSTWASTRCPSPVSRWAGSPASPRPVTSSTPVSTPARR
jgi:hypothetical protein